MNETIKLLQSHRSIRKYTDREIAPELIAEIIKSAQSASTSSFLQPYTIIGVKNKEKKKTLAALCGDQQNVEDAALFLVFCADLNRLERACTKNNKEMVVGFTEPFIIGTVDASILAQNALVAAESLGLGGVFVGGIRNNPEEVSKLLKLPNQVYPVVGMCLGYPKQDPGVKPRLPMELVYNEEEYSTGDEAVLDEYDKLVSEYYINRTKGKIDTTWTQTVADKMDKELRPHMREFLKSKGFEFK